MLSFHVVVKAAVFPGNFEAEIASICRPPFGPNPQPQQMRGARQSLRPAWFDVDSSASATGMVCKTESGEEQGNKKNH